MGPTSTKRNLQPNAFQPTGTVVLIAAALLSVATLAAGMLWSTDAMVAGSYRLAMVAPSNPADPIGPQQRPSNRTGLPIAGSEHYWLEQTPPSGMLPATHAPAASRLALALGAQMTLPGPDGTSRTFEAIDIRPTGGLIRASAPAGSGTAASAEQGYVVTWREVGKTAEGAAVLRTIIDTVAATGDAAAAARPGHAL